MEAGSRVLGHIQFADFLLSLRLSAMMTGHMVLALMTVVLGVTSAQLTNDDTNYVDTGADPNQGYYTGQYNTGVYSPYPADTSAPAVQLSETDRYIENNHPRHCCSFSYAQSLCMI